MPKGFSIIVSPQGSAKINFSSIVVNESKKKVIISWLLIQQKEMSFWDSLSTSAKHEKTTELEIFSFHEANNKFGGNLFNLQSSHIQASCRAWA